MTNEVTGSKNRKLLSEAMWLILATLTIAALGCREDVAAPVTAQTTAGQSQSEIEAAETGMTQTSVAENQVVAEEERTAATETDSESDVLANTDQESVAQHEIDRNNLLKQKSHLLKLTPEEVEWQRKFASIKKVLRKENKQLGTPGPAPIKGATRISDVEAGIGAGGGQLKLAIQAGGDVNGQSKSMNDWSEVGGWTLLHKAAHNGYLEHTKLLVEFGADTAATLDDGKTPADVAKENGKDDVFQYLSQLPKR